MSQSVAIDSRHASVDQSLARLVESLTERLQAGESIDRATVAREHPEFASQLEQLWPALQALANLSNSLGRPSQGHGAELHPAAEEWGTLGDYAIHREVGRGGMGVVYEATQISLSRRVALKVLPFAATMDKRQLQRFHNEARAAASLEHANIVPVYGVGTERGVHYYAMRFIEGQSLEAVLQEMRAQPSEVLKTSEGCSPQTRAQASTLKSSKRGRNDWRRIAELAIQAAEALEHAHQSGVVHRDVKPANLLLDEEGKLWITDFGLAQIQSDARLTITGDLVGTLRYMSPEQALAKRVIVDHRTDIYSLGATIYEVMTLKPVFAGQDRQELLRQIAFEEPVAPRRLERAIPVELETVILKALEKNPADRYGTAKEMAEDLKRFLKDEPTRARRAGLWLRGRKWGRRHVAAVRASLAGLIVTAIAVAITAGWRVRDRTTREMETQRELKTALEDADRWQKAQKVPEALAALRRAQSALAAGIATPTVVKQIHARLADLKTLETLEELRALPTLLGDREIFNFAEFDAKYNLAFQAYGIDIGALSHDQAALRIRERSVAIELAAALDHWSYVAKQVRSEDTSRWKRLLALARAVDPDPVRSGIRQALEQGNTVALRGLASPTKIEKLPSSTVLVIGLALEAERDLEGALQLLQRAHRQHFADFWINYQLACYCGLQSPPNDVEAVRFFSAAVALRPESAPAHFGLGTALAYTKHSDDALAHWRTAIKLAPTYRSFFSYDVARGLKRPGESDLVGTKLRYWLGAKVDTSESHRQLGFILSEEGRWGEAIVAFKEAIRRQPDLLEAQRELAIVLAKKGQKDEAIEALNKSQSIGAAQKIVWGTAELTQGLASALVETGQWDDASIFYQEAIAGYRKAIELSPNTSASLHNTLAWLLVSCPDRRLREPKHAVVNAEIAVKLQPKNGDLWNTLGAAYYHNGNWQDALEALEKAKKLRDRIVNYNHDGYFFLAMAHWKLGNKELAHDYYNRGLQWMDLWKTHEDNVNNRRTRAEATELLGFGAIRDIALPSSLRGQE